MQIRVLGPLEVVDGGGTVAIRGRRLRRLIAALTLHANRVVSTETLIDLIWPDGLPEDPVGSLQKHVWTLRRTLPDAERVVTTAPDGQGYRLVVVDEEVDAVEFEAVVALGRRALEAGRPDEAADLLSRGLSLWRGPALTDLCDGESGQAAAARLEEMRLAALEDRIDIDLAAGRASEVVGELDHLVKTHPYRERIWGGLMRARYQTGRQADALRTFQDARRVLHDELGLEPGEELRRLEQRILAHDPALLAPPRPPLPSSGNLPIPTTTFIGRAEDLVEVSRLLRSTRMVTLVGPGGVGKTRLALEASAASASRYDDGVWVAELGRVERPDAVTHAVVDAIGVRPRRASSTLDALVNGLAERQVLLILDTCEHVVGAAAQLIDTLLQRCSRLTVLATSRELLRVPGEHAYDVRPLATPEPEQPQKWATATLAPALELLIDRAQAATGTREVRPPDVTTLAEIARRLDGLPLALELAAPRLRSMTPLELLDRLGRPLEQLVGGPRTVDRRQQTLRATVEWSYALLEQRHRAVFDRLSVFAGGASLENAEAICTADEVPRAEMLAVLVDLVDKSVVVAARDDRFGAGGQTRYHLLDTLRDFGRERLAERTELDKVRSDHAHHFRTFAVEQWRRLTGPGELDALANLDREFENLRAAHVWAMESGDADVALTLPATLRWWAQMQLRREVFEWAARAVDAFGSDEPDGDRLARALATVATGRWMTGDFQTTADLCERALSMASGARARADVVHPLGMTAFWQGRLDDCIRLQHEAAALAADAGDGYSAALWLTPVVLSHSYRGDLDSALPVLDEQARRLERLGQPAAGMALALHHYTRGEALLETAPDQSLDALDHSLSICRTGVSPWVTGIALLSATSLRARHGDPQSAIDAFADAVRLWWRAGEWPQQWTTLRNLIELLNRMGEHRAGALLLGACDSAKDAPTLFGAGAERQAATTRSLIGALGHDGFDAARADGSRLTRAEVVAFALESLERAKRQ